MIRLQQHKHMLGSEAYITLIGPSEQVLADLFESVWQELNVFEHTFSRFLSDSELSYVNERAGLPTEVSPEFVALACLANEYADRTDGLYDPFVLPALQRAGYKGSWPLMENPGNTPDFTGRDFTKSLKIHINENSVTLPQNTALDFGGIGKGYALDVLGQVLQRESIGHYWISLGGDILASGNDIDGKAWVIPVGSALDEAEDCAQMRIHQGRRAVASSGIVKRAGEGWNHLIDPRTGQSTTTDILSASVAADAGVSADVYAKCLVLAGSQQAQELAERLGVLNYVLQVKTKRGTVEVFKQGEFE